MVRQSHQAESPIDARASEKELEYRVGQGEAGGETGRLLRHGLLNAGGLVVIAAIGFILVPIMLTGLGAEMYGVWIAALALCELLATFDLGLGWAVTREVAKGSGTDPSRFVAIAGTAILVLGAIGMLLIAGVGHWLIGALRLGPNVADTGFPVFLAIGVGFFGEALIGYLTAILYGLRRFDLVTAFQVALTLLRAGGFILILELGLDLAALSQWYAVSTWLAAAAGALVLGSLCPAFKPRFAWIELSTLRAQARFGLASQFTALGTAAIWRAPVLMLGVMGGAGAIVPLHVGQRLPLFAYGIGWRIAESTFPAASQYHSLDDLRRSREVLVAGTRWSLIALLPVGVTMAALAPWLLELWLGSADTAVVSVLRITTAAVLAHMLGAVALHVLWARGRAGLVLLIVGGMTIAICIAAFWAIPRFGSVGAAWATVIPMLLGSVAMLAFASWACATRLPDTLRDVLAGIVLPSIAALCTSLLLQGWLHGYGWLGIIGASILAGAVFLSTLCLTNGAERARLASAIDGLRPILRKSKALRVFRDFVANAWLFDGRYTRRDYWDALFEKERDPWRYASDPEHGSQRFVAALAMLDVTSRGQASLGNVLEIGCAEGRFSELLEDKCTRLLAVDISQEALERGRCRRAWQSSVEFRQWDLLRDPLPGDQFDVVIVMGVLDYYTKIGQLKRIRDRLVRLVRPGGYLLIESTRTGGDLENTWWRRAFPRGRWINPFIGRHISLREVNEQRTEICVRTIYRVYP